MKRFTILLMVSSLFVLFNVADAQNPAIRQTSNKQKEKAIAAEKTMLPYKARFTKFATGDPRYSVMVLNAWKAWDDNRLDDIADMLADTVTAYLADGTVIKGKDAFINGGKAYRAGFTAVKSEVVAYTSMKHLEGRQGTSVWIWGDEYDTKLDGTTQKSILHEVWAFNKDGKVDLVLQYSRPDPQSAAASRKADEEALRKADAAWAATATEKKSRSISILLPMT